jgi:LCP family protein required for cell wall assembly
VTAPARGRARARRTWPQRLLIGGNILLILICLLTAGGLAYGYSKLSAIGRVQLGNSLAPVDKAASGGAENFLIVGTDSAEGLDPKDPVLAGRPGGLRSDTIMILRLDPNSDHAQLLSLPRDLYVPIDGQRGRDKINSAIQGGPERLINTIKSNFGIPINHYIEMNFFAFRSIVAAVGGVPVYFPTPVRDQQSGLEVENTGCVTLDPIQALAYARSRDFEYFQNGRWKSDPSGDLGRISRQQAFIRQVLQRAIDKGARNPAVLNDLIDAGTSALHLDPSLTPGDVVSLGLRFKDFNPQNLDTYSAPSSSTMVQGASVQLLNVQQAEPVFDLFRGVDANAVDSTVVFVENGTANAGLGNKAAGDLRSVGFSVPPDYVNDADRFDYPRTVVRYMPGDEGKAVQVASHLNVPPIVEETNYIVNADVVVVVGADWQGARSSPGATDALPTSTDTTSTTTTPNTVPSTTTTIGVVPQTPEDVSC